MTYDRNQQGNAGSVSGIPHTEGDRQGGWSDANQNTDVFNAAAAPKTGGVVQIAGSSGAGEAHQALPPSRRPSVLVAENLEVRCAAILHQINERIEAQAVYAQAEIKAMAVSRRRSIGQLTRLDHLARKARPEPRGTIFMPALFRGAVLRLFKDQDYGARLLRELR